MKKLWILYLFHILDSLFFLKFFNSFQILIFFQRRKKPRKKSDSALIDDNSTVASISKLDFSKYSNLGIGKQKPRITSHSFKSRIYSQKWSKGETKLFFRALGLFGTDFSMMTMMFKGRTRSQIINKFHKEEKENPQKIEKALNSHKNCESKLLTRYTHFLESAKKESLSKEGNNRVRLNSSSSLDSTDQTMYEELFKCIKQGLQHLQSRSCAQDRSSIRSSIRSSSRLQETPSFSNSKAPSMSGDSTMSSSRLHE